MKEAFDEFGEIADWNQSHFVGISLLAGRTVESLQLKAFSENPTSELHAYPEAFVEIQERNFGTSDQRFGETIHKLIQVAGTRGLRRALPAYVGARMRRPQLLKFLDDREGLDFVMTHWTTAIHQKLLAHCLTPPAVTKLTVAQRLARIYSYDEQSLHNATEDDAKQIADLAAFVSANAQKQDEVATTQNASHISRFLKDQAKAGQIISIPRALLDQALHLVEAPDPISTSEIVDVLALADGDAPGPLALPDDAPLLALAPGAVPGPLAHAGGAAPLAVADDAAPLALAVGAAPLMAFVQVVDPHPESKHQVRTGHVARKKHDVNVLEFVPSENDEGCLLIHVGEGTERVLDVRAWAAPDTFRMLMQSSRVWTCRPGELVLSMERVGEVSDALLPPLQLQPLVDPFDGRATEPGDVVDVEGVGLAHGLSRAIRTLVSARAFAELDTFIPFSEMVGVHLHDVQALVARGVVEQKDDVLFGLGFAAKLTNLAPRGVLRLTGSAPFRDLPPSKKPVLQWSKLEVLRQLLREGWEPKDAITRAAYRKGGSRKVLAGSDLRPLSYYACLLKSQDIFDKPGGVKKHKMKSK